MARLDTTLYVGQNGRLMKSVLGLVGVTALLVSCSGSGGDVVFDDSALAGRSGTGTGASSGADAGGAGNNGGTSATAGTESTSGTDAGGDSGTSGTGGGGKAGAGGMSGASGTGGESNGGSAGGGPMVPEVIFVASSGDDAADCGLTPETACKTISHGVERGVAAMRSDVYVQAGHYAEVVVLRAGVSVLGGFDNDWKSGARTDEAHQVVIEGGSDETTKENVAVWAHDLGTKASLENLVIQAPDAKGQRANAKDGRSSYGVHAVSAKLSLKDVDIKAGKGETGADGDAGQDAVSVSATDGMNGTVGGAGAGNVMGVGCSLETSPGGLPGVNACEGPSTVDMSGGKGGYGGARDTTCAAATWQSVYTAQPGGDGDDAKTVLGSAGKAGSHGTGGGPAGPGSLACGVTGSGNPGGLQNGAGGKAGSGGAVLSGFWYGAPGGNGATGQNGGGGGGGGGSGACDINVAGTSDSRGSGGGGGGAGGCAARGGGSGGGGGGGSFGIFAVGSSITVTNVTVTRGAAGDAGKGGSGGQGQVGGLGQAGGAHPGTAAAAGKGGDGAHGGHGGGGAGGNGGASYGIVLSSGSALDGALTVMGGAAGKGGDGGVSAPNAAEILRDGNPGEKGADGGFGDKLEL